jgi:hypothetical protein
MPVSVFRSIAYLRHENHAATPLISSRKPSQIFNFANIPAFIERCEIRAKSDLIDTGKKR